MISYSSISFKILLVFSILLGIIVTTHIIVVLLINNSMYYNTILMYTLFFLSLLLVVCLITLIVKTTKKTKQITNIFFNKCDPKKALELLETCIDESQTKKTKLYLMQLKVMIEFRLGEYQKVKKTLEYNIRKDTLDLISILLWEHNKNMVSIALNEIDTEEKQKNFLNFKNTYPKKEQFIKEYYEAQEKYYYFKNCKYEDLDIYYKKELDISKTLLEKVTYNANLAVIYVNQNKIDKAKEAINFVLQNGNTMYVVEECKRLLEKVEGK